MVKNSIYFLIITTVFVNLNSCASIVSRNDYSVSIRSMPEEARFEIYNEDGEKIHSGTTPQSVVLDSEDGFFDGETYTIIFQKSGYFEKTTTLDSGIDGWYFGNIIFGGLIGFLIIDPATGSMFSLPDEFIQNLDKNDTAQKNYKLKIVTLADIPTEFWGHLVSVD